MPDYNPRPIQFHGIDNLSTPSSLISKRRLKPPSDLVLKATKPTTDYPQDGSEPASSCRTCNKTSLRNPRLCNDCQIWNDAHHIFNCLSTTRLNKGSEHPKPITLGQMLARKACLMCQAVSDGALESLNVNDNRLEDQLLDVEIRNYGPFCLSKSQYGTINPALSTFPNTSMPLYLTEPNDMRLVDHSNFPDPSQERLAPIRTVIYLVMTAPLGSHLRSRFPHLDEYKTPNEAKKHWSDDKGLGTHRCTGSDNPDELLQPTFGLQIDLTYGRGTLDLSAVVRWNDEYINTAQFSGLLDSCEHGHKDESRHGSIETRKCSLDADHELLPAGFRAINTYDYCVVELPSSPLSRYVTLSYTWGGTPEVKELQLEQSNQNALCKPGCLKLLSSIPDLILDAIRLCADMGERYLWVDRLCIVQDDLEAKLEQINAMDRIYHMASFTLIAAVPPGIGLAGVVGRPRRSQVSNWNRKFHLKYRFIVDNFSPNISKSFWNSRGWTYQEFALSRRVIFITEWQAYWICNRHSSQEELGEIMTTTRPFQLHKFSHYRPAVADYTSRNLSFESDILNAFAGIGNRLAKKMGKPLSYGLPERYFAKALLWEQTETIETRETAPDIPSWSWAAWRGRVLYELNSGVEKRETGTLVRFYIVDNDCGLRRILEDEAWFSKGLNFDNLDTLPAVDPLDAEMRYMPTKDASLEWRTSIQNPWTVATDGTVDETVVGAFCRPGRLIFRTTSAYVRLHVPAGSIYQSSTDYTKLDICSRDGLIVGEMAQLPKDWVNNNVRLNEDHEVIVITAGIASENSRYAQTHATLHTSGEYQRPRMEDSLWYLHVMLISRDDDGVARRIAIGTVDLKLWIDCRPRWLTIVLA